MMSAFDVLVSQMRNKETQSQQNLESEISRRESHRQQEKLQQITRTRTDLKRLQQRRKDLLRNLKGIRIGIQNRLHSGIREEFKQSAATFHTCQYQQDQFNPFLLKLGMPFFSMLTCLTTCALGLFWVWSTMGLDAVGGNIGFTVGLAITALLVIDIIGFYAFYGVLNIIQGFFKNKQAYRRLLEACIFAGFLLALGCFSGNIIMRFMEVGI